MLWLILLAPIVGGALFCGRADRRARRRPPMPERSLPPHHDDPAALAADDPLGALARYGTNADARRLEGDGVDLGALGYHHRHGG